MIKSQRFLLRQGFSRRGRATWPTRRRFRADPCTSCSVAFFSNQPNNHKEDDDSVLWQHWMEQLRSPPNMITVARIASTPLLAYCIINGHSHAALIGCLVAGASDVVDGYLAKNYNMATVLGTYLDPLADKILINTLAVSLWTASILPSPLVGLWLARDVALTTGAYWHVASQTDADRRVIDPLTTPLKVHPTTVSKINTGLQFATLAVGIVHPIVALPEVLEALCWVTGATTIASGLSYVGYSAFESSGNDKGDQPR